MINTARKNSRFILLLFFSFFALVLSACSNGDDNKSAKPPKELQMTETTGTTNSTNLDRTSNNQSDGVNNDPGLLDAFSYNPNENNDFPLNNFQPFEPQINNSTNTETERPRGADNSKPSSVSVNPQTPTTQKPTTASASATTEKQQPTSSQRTATTAESAPRLVVSISILERKTSSIRFSYRVSCSGEASISVFISGPSIDESYLDRGTKTCNKTYQDTASVLAPGSPYNLTVNASKTSQTGSRQVKTSTLERSQPVTTSNSGGCNGIC